MYVAENGSVEIKGGAISENKSNTDELGNGGGGVYVSGGTVNMTGGKISGNTAVRAGGGLNVGSGTFTMNGGEISGNKANYGAGVYILSGSATVKSGKIGGNEATTSGGVYVAGGKLAINGGEISGNTAVYGGGLYVTENGTVEMTGGSVSGNTAENGGGVRNNGTFKMSGGAISDNTATVNGGGLHVYTDGEVEINGGEISGNTATANGGGVYVDGGALEMKEGTVTNNAAVLGAGVYVDSGAVTVTGTARIIYNDATENGGGIYVNGANAATLNDIGGYVSNNMAVVGGGIYVGGGNAATVTVGGYAVVGENTAATYGGGLAVLGGASVEITDDSSITYNKAENGGGAYVSDDGSVLALTNEGAFTYNKAILGGAVYVTTSGSFNMGSGTLSVNEAENGGAVYVNNATFTLSDGEISANIVSENGGGVYVSSGTSTFTMNGGLIGGDEADLANSAVLGGGVYVAGGKATLSGGKITGNTATSNGGGVYFFAGTLEASGNPEINENTMNGIASNLYLYNGKMINIVGGLTKGANIGVTSKDRITDGYQTNGNGAAQKDYFFGDIPFTEVVFDNGEIYLIINNKDAWNAAVEESLAKGGAPVQFLLADRWTAEDGSFGSGTGFTDSGAIKLPVGAHINLNLNGYMINRGLDTIVTDGSVFYVEGTLVISGISGQITGGASEQGGGIYVADGGLLTLSVGLIQDNEADLGGGVYVDSGATFEMTGGALRSNEATVNGGGVYVAEGGKLTLTGGTIGGAGYTNTAAEQGGGVYTCGDFTMSGGAISNNVANVTAASDVYGGGGVNVAKGTFNFENGTISNNTAANGYGGGVNNNGTFEMTGGTISNNTALNGAGIAGNGTLDMLGGEISGNTATEYGGGVYVVDGKVNLNDGTITGNSAANGGGVGACGGRIEINGVKINGNNATNGAGVYAYSDIHSLKFTGGEISGNTATQYGGGIYTCVELTMTDGKISGNNAITGAGMYITLLNSTATLTMNGGEISNNTANNYGGGAHISVGTLKMTGGLISGNSAEVGGGVCNYSTESIFVMEGGAISNNAATSTGGGVDVTSGTFTLTNGTISDNTATTKGGGVYAFGAFEMKNGTITGNSAANGGGVNVEYGTFTMVKGTVSNNTATNGGGVYADGTFEFKSGEISSNTSSSNGGGVFVNSGTFTMSTGTISNNVAANGGGVYVEDGATFNLNGGKIIANSASTLGGGVYVVATAIMNMSGSPMVYGNTAAGVESNVYLTANQLIIITGLLSVNGVVAYVGITMYDPKLFTQNFRATNTDYTPDLRPETVFFSDDSEYMVSADAAGEAVLKEKDNSQTAVVWQLSKDGGNTWAIIDAPYYSIRYNANDNGYAVRAINVDGEEVEFTWTTDENGTSINANSFGSEGIGSYKFVINSDKYTNAALTVEILPAILLWQYSTDGDATWRDLTVDSFVYTGATYFIRACIQDVNAATGYSVVETFLKTMKDVDDYVFSIDSELYENTTLNFSITKRYVTVEWNFGDALGNADDGYYWNYDGLAHSPVAVLDGISGDLAGVDLVYSYAWSAGKDFSEAQAYAGTYTLNVSLNDSNVELSNTSVKYEIVGILLSLVWTDKDGNEGDEFTYEYNSEEQGVKFIVSGLVAGDEVKPYVTYATRAGKIIDGEPVAAGYYTATVKLPADCYSYVFDKTYTCQIAITKKSVKVEWGTNKDGTYVWTFNGQSKSPEVIIIDPFTGEQTVEPYKLEYATVAANGDIGTYTPNVPITAGDYIVRVTMKNVGSNIALDESTTTQKFTIAKRGVNITWTGGKGFYYDEDNRVYYWYYDGEEHSIVAEISVAGYAVYDGDKIIDNLDIVRLDVDKKLLDAESATAKVALADSTFNENFYILGNASQVYEVRKAIISTVVWTDPLLNKYYEGDTPSYDFGTVSGENGPNLTALANGTLELIVSYSKTYAGDWAVDETVGYIAYATLSDKDAANYEFAEGAEYATLKFFITAVGGYKQDIDVTWVVFVNDNEYVTLEDYLKDGGFVYNGKVQYPTPVYIKDSGEVIKLELNMNSVGADAGDYTARLKPSSVYNISDEDFTYDYVINQLKINVKWQNSQYDSDTACEYVYNGKAQAPYAYVDGTYDFDVIITVNGEVNAGNHTATAVVGDNFKIVKGATKDYVIKKLGIGAGLVVWDFANAGASGDADNGWYWVFDGKEHGPTAMIPKANLGDDFDVDLVLVVTGNTSEIGTHTAYAVLNSSIALHNNFYLTDASSAQFEIVQVKVGQVYWTDGEHVYEDGAAGETGLEFTFNGEEKADKLKAYYYDAEGNKVDLTVAVIGGTAVNAGTYSARVTSELDFATTPSCTFKIKAMELDAEWKNTTVTFNNEEQKPTITLSDGVGGYKLEEGEDKDYVITGFITAGTYTVQIKFLNKNYTVAEENLTCKFVIEKITLSEGDDFEWAKDGYDQDKGVYVHAPELEEFTYSLDEDGEKVVTFEIGYTGVTTTVGKHTVTAYIKSATLTVDGEEYDVTDCFKLDAEKEYVVNAQTVTVEWVGKADVEEGENEFAWAYDGNPHAPEAYITTEGGERIKLDVYGAEINARDKAYTATAVLPAGYALANGSSTATQEYFINKATIEVIWEFGDLEADENGVYSWTYGDNVEIKVYIKVTTVDEDGSVTVTKGAELTVTGIETDAGTHTATVMQNDGNYAFKTADEATREYVIKPLEVYVVWYGADGTANDASKNFEWTFTGKAIAPKAYLADEDGNLIKDKDNNPIPVEVSGGVAEVGEHTAQAVDTFVNYVFAEEFTKTYKVLAKDLADNDFKWTADGATKVEGLTFTYEYSGDNIMPVPSADVEDVEFNVTIKNADGPVLAITEVGTYTITVTSRDENYSVPEDMKTVTVIVTARNVKVDWDKTQLVYNGEKQIPKAYFEDVAGNLIELEVTVDGDSRKAGVEYTATADLSSTNYELDADTKTYTFEIAQKEINVEFVWEDVTYDGKEHAPTPIVVLGAAETEGITVVYKITKNGADAAGDGEKVKNAGEYVMTVSLDGENKGNYKLVNAECKFTINKVALTVTADDKKVTYGGDKPTYTATIKGFISEEEETKLTEALNERINQWLRCSYINTTVPGEYAIEIATRWLNDFLENYEVTPKNGTLTVEPAANKLVWQGENANNLEFVYNGKSNLPKAYYYDQSGRKISLNVKLAELQDGEYVVKEGTAVNVGTYYAVIVDEDGNVVKGDGSYTFDNYGTAFEITQLEITVNIKDMPFTYGDIDKDNLEEILGEGSGWYYADSYVIPDDLGIKLTITGKYDKGNYLETGVYAITASWDETAHGNNYKVEFVDEGSRELIVNLAKVTVKDYDFVIGEDGMLNVYDNYGILDGNGYESDFIKDVYDNNPKKFLTIAGYQDAEIEQYFRLLEGDELPNPGTGLYTDERPESLFEEGTYVFNFKVLIPNHEDFVGRLYVKVDYASNYLFVKVDGKGTYTSEYGYEVTENLAKELLEKGYAEYDTNISRVDEETFLDWVTATVVDEKGNEVTGKLPVGTYKVFFGLNEKADEKYSIYKATTRFVNLEVTKYVIDIDWGNDDNLKYEYDGNVHMPVIKVEGTVLDDSCKVSDGVYAITVNGEVVKVTVTVDGDFTSEGGHSVLVTIDGENFSISEDDSLRSVSIIEPTKTVEVEVPGNGEAKKGLETWQLGLIIGAALLLLLLVIILLIALTKRKPVVMNDSDGFYDDVSESDLQG
ncbi:MAG: hypothetical protein K2O28_00845 [Clostridia bacterium]|nr:hypothetical protein [Clostridia bacterium]